MNIARQIWHGKNSLGEDLLLTKFNDGTFWSSSNRKAIQFEINGPGVQKDSEPLEFRNLMKNPPLIEVLAFWEKGYDEFNVFLVKYKNEERGVIIRADQVKPNIFNDYVHGWNLWKLDELKKHHSVDPLVHCIFNKHSTIDFRGQNTVSTKICKCDIIQLMNFGHNAECAEKRK